MEPVSRKSSAPDCTANPATGKDANAHVSGASMRVLFFSMSDSQPIPDGRLFCCRFRMIGSTRSCCSLALSKLIVSDPKGKRFSDTSVSYQATLNGTQCATLHP